MRVLLSPGHRAGAERGSIAVMTALVTFVLMVVSSFAVDLGVAYNSKRQLQTSADAAVLAAGAVYAKYPGTCSQLAANATYRAEAQAAADHYRGENRAGSTGVTIAPACNSEGELEVSYSASGFTETVFAKVIGVTTISTQRDAAAVVDVPNSIDYGIRPYALCSADIPTGPTASGVVEVTPPGQAHGGSSCASGQSPGNWWFNVCNIPGGGTSQGSPADMASAITNGCTNKVRIVTPQDSTDSSTLSSSLTASCATGFPYSSTCLQGDTGNSSLSNTEAYGAWDTVMGKTIYLPVFCSDPICTPDTVNGSGSNVYYPVYSIAAVVVCGYHIYDKNNEVSTAGDCAGNTWTKAVLESRDKKDIYLYLRFVRVLTSQDQTTSDCALGTSCDGGLRRVRLSK